MRPVLTYYGGKQRMAERIVSLLPAHHHYCEPFAGGAAVFFAKGPLGPPSRYTETLNDSNENIITLYRVLQEPTKREHLFAKLEWTPCSLSEWRRGRVEMILTELKDRMRWVQLECRDALAVIDKYDCPGIVFYCDPPYPDADQGPYPGYTQADFEQLVARLEQCQGSVVLSCYENAAVPEHWERINVRTRATTVAGMKVNEERVEVLWRVDRSERPQLQLFR